MRNIVESLIHDRELYIPLYIDQLVEFVDANVVKYNF